MTTNTTLTHTTNVPGTLTVNELWLGYCSSKFAAAYGVVERDASHPLVLKMAQKTLAKND